MAQETKRIKLLGKRGKNKFVLVDSEDFNELNKYKWYLSKIGYAVAYQKGYMHRFIKETPKGLITDHINMNKLDNRKENLRLCLQAENLRNRLKPKSNTTGYKGVYWNEKRKVWQTYITKNYKHYFAGSFDLKEEASNAYNFKAKELFGDFARLNLIIK